MTVVSPFGRTCPPRTRVFDLARSKTAQDVLRRSRSGGSHGLRLRNIFETALHPIGDERLRHWRSYCKPDPGFGKTPCFAAHFRQAYEPIFVVSVGLGAESTTMAIKLYHAPPSPNSRK